MHPQTTFTDKVSMSPGNGDIVDGMLSFQFFSCQKGCRPLLRLKDIPGFQPTGWFPAVGAYIIERM